MDRQHVLIPDCANDVPKVEEMLVALVAAGYEMHAVCMWAPLEETRARGMPRSLREGKLWSPSTGNPNNQPPQQDQQTQEPADGEASTARTLRALVGANAEEALVVAEEALVIDTAGFRVQIGRGTSCMWRVLAK